MFSRVHIAADVAKEVMQAYSDGWDTDENRGYQNRKLQFRAKTPVSPDEAARIMAKACPGGYNEFKAKLLTKLPPGCQVFLGRDYSVAVYVKGLDDAIIPKLKKALRADEVDQEPDGSVRIWWD